MISYYHLISAECRTYIGLLAYFSRIQLYKTYLKNCLLQHFSGANFFASLMNKFGVIDDGNLKRIKILVLSINIYNQSVGFVHYNWTSTHERGWLKVT
jgi:hypothetical protein